MCLSVSVSLSRSLAPYVYPMYADNCALYIFALSHTHTHTLTCVCVCARARVCVCVINHLLSHRIAFFQVEFSFTQHGFRYVEITFPGSVGLPGPTMESLEFIVVRSSVDVAGDLTVSDSMLQKVHHNYFYGQASNLMMVPSDCDNRDERFGWTGTAPSPPAFRVVRRPKWKCHGPLVTGVRCTLTSVSSRFGSMACLLVLC